VSPRQGKQAYSTIARSSSLLNQVECCRFFRSSRDFSVAVLLRQARRRRASDFQKMLVPLNIVTA